MEYLHSEICIGECTSPVFIISLAKDVDRREGLKRFISSDIVENYFPGSDLRGIDPEKIEQHCDVKALLDNPSYSRKLRTGEVGCTLSHRRIYQYMIDHNLPYAVVFEDDVLPKLNWKSTLENALKKIEYFERGKAIMIHMGLPYYRALGKKRVVFWRNRTISISPDIRIIERNSNDDFWLGHSYIISQEAARRILNYFPLISCMCDDWRAFYTKGCFDIVLLTECCFDQDFTYNSNLREKHPVELFGRGVFFGLNTVPIYLLKKIRNFFTFFNLNRYFFLNVETFNSSK